MTEVFNEKIFIVEVIITKFAASLKPEQDQRTTEMKKRILNILMLLLSAAVLASCSMEMEPEHWGDMMGDKDIRSIIITGAVTDASTGQPLEDITIHFKAYPQDIPDASPIFTDEVHSTSSGTFTIHASGNIYESLLCVLTAQDAGNIYESKTNQVIVTWSGPSFDRNSGTFVVNDCTFQLKKAE